MESVLKRDDRALARIAPALAAAQLKHAWAAALAVPAVAGALTALAGAVWSLAAGAVPATLAMIALSQLYPAAVGLCAVAVLSGDRLAEMQESTPVGFRAVQTMRASLLLLGGAAGALVMFAPLEALGLVYVDRGWIGFVTPVGGALIMVLAAFAAAAATGSARSAALVVILVWLFLALFWDPNVVPLIAQRGIPLLAALAAAACAWRALGIPGRARAKRGGAR